MGRRTYSLQNNIARLVYLTQLAAGKVLKRRMFLSQTVDVTNPGEWPVNLDMASLSQSENLTKPWQA